MKTKRSILNFITDVVPMLIVSILGIFKLKLFIKYLGNDTLGLYQLFTQIMVYIALVDGGLTSAVLHALYKPNTKGDTKEMNDILVGAKKTFNLIGIIIFGIAFVISFFIKFFIKDCSYGMGYLMIVFLLFSLSNVFSYFFVPDQVLLEVREKKYLSNICLQTGQILLSVLEIVMLMLGFSFVGILIMHACVKLLANIATVIIARKVNKDISFKSDKPNYEFRSKIKDLMVHKVNGLIGSNIDILIISKVMGLDSVAIYSIYNYIINMLRNIIGKVSSSIVAIVGNKNEEDNEGTYKIYMELNHMLFYIAIIVCVPLLLAINGFIDIWYEKSIATSLIVALSFCLLLFFFIIKLSTTTFVTSMGLFKETKKCAYVDMSVNFVLSMLLVYKIGIGGVLIATVISTFIAEYIMKTLVLYRNSFKNSSLDFFIGNIKFFIIVIIDYIISYLLIGSININSIIKWFGVYSIFTIINAGVVFCLFKAIGCLDFVDRFKKIFKR